ncbi:ran GTPase-activating protein [Anopheles gambiae]|uniref:RanGAP1_C domain-containing protein n=1 Tax=Anopheles coluzzii TaxID=1518534 RepID=A0A6E8VWF5_ANOCL|nr:ran GTPase-activating protein [Anopheles gambiae]XP_040231464.2 ran GTPase-activating protein [Anopheles coluzzii]
MASFNLTAITSALTDLDQHGVKWVGKASKWGTEAEAKDLIDAINACKDMRFLNLEGNTLGVEAAKGIARALEKHPELKQALWKDLFTGRMKEEIPIALKALGQGMITAGAQLTVLDCSDNALGPNGMVGLVDLLKSATCYTLEQLKLNNCGLGIEGGTMLAKALLEGHTASRKVGKPLALKVFIAGRNRLENAGAKALSEMFATVGTLEQIEMPQNGIYHVGITALSDAFRVNRNLRILNLNDNTIGPKGAAALSVAVQDLHHLREINFGDCLLKTKGAVLIGEALHQAHTELEVMDFGYNEIGPDGGFALVNASANKGRLRSLVLNGNQFGDECCEQMKELMRTYERDRAMELEEDAGDVDGEEEEEEDDDDGEEEEEEEEEDDEDEEDEDEDDDETADEDEDVDETVEGYGEGEEEDAEESLLTRMKQHSMSKTNGGTAHDASAVSIDLDTTLPCTVDSFIRQHYPSETLFQSLPDKDKVAAFRDYLKAIPQEDYLVHTAFTILKCSDLCESQPDALAVALALYKDAFEFARANRRLKSLRNFLLIQLGLLKSEDRSFRPNYNVQNCQRALRDALKQNLIPEEETSMFKTFLDHKV